MEHLELVDRVYMSVKQMILNQELAPGEKLVQEKLASRLGVSRSPLLKALQRLESELLVRSIPRRGMYVREVNHRDIKDVFECRAVIEGLCARLTAEKISSKQLKALEACFTPFVGQEDIDRETYAKADRKFHQYLLEFSGNRVVTRLEMLTNIHLTAFQAGLLRPPTETLPEHLEIVAAIKKGDGLLAEKLLRKHITTSLQVLILSMEGE